MPHGNVLMCTVYYSVRCMHPPSVITSGFFIEYFISMVPTNNYRGFPKRTCNNNVINNALGAKHVHVCAEQCALKGCCSVVHAHIIHACTHRSNVKMDKWRESDTSSEFG